MLASLLWSACGGHEPRLPPERRSLSDEDTAWAMARDRLVDPKTCLFQRPTYCVRDPTVLDVFLQHELDRSFDGHMPLEPRQVSQVALAARPHLLDHLASDGRRHVEARIAAHYAAPPSSVTEGTVSVLVGIPPGTITSVRQGRVTMSSPYVERGEWSSSEAAAMFERFAHVGSDGRIVLRVEIPLGAKTRRLEIGWDRPAGQVYVWDRADPTSGWTAPIHADGWPAYRDGRATLHTSALKRCPTPRYGAVPDCTVVSSPSPASPDAPPTPPAAPPTQPASPPPPPAPPVREPTTR